MRTETPQAGSAFAGSALLRSLTLSVLLHFGLFASLGEHQQKKNALTHESPPVLLVMLANSKTSAQVIPPPSSGIPIVQNKPLEPDSINGQKTAATALPSSTDGKSSQEDAPQQPTPSLNIITPSLPHYYTRPELDTPPYLLKEELDETLAAVGNLESGQAELNLWINDLGQTTGVELVASDLSNESQQKIHEAYAKSLFSAGMKNGLAVHSRIRVKILFGEEQIPPTYHLPKNSAQRLVPQ